MTAIPLYVDKMCGFCIAFNISWFIISIVRSDITLEAKDLKVYKVYISDFTYMKNPLVYSLKKIDGSVDHCSGLLVNALLE